MNFMIRSLLLLGSLVWLAVCAKQFLSLGVMQRPETMSEHLPLMIQILVAVLLLKSAWQGKRDDSH
jgi:hypothetical protein